MASRVSRHVTVQPDGRIVIDAPELEPGTHAEVIVIPEQPRQGPNRSLRSLIGTGRGAFGTPDEADRFLRAERDAWE